MEDKLNVYEVTSFRGALSDYEDKGLPGAFKFGANLDIRKRIDSLSCNQALVDEGLLEGSRSPSASESPSPSPSPSPSLSESPSPSPSTGESPSPSTTPSLSPSLSPSVTESSSPSPSPSPSAGLTTTFEDLIRFFVKCSDGYVYGFGDTGHIYRRDADNYWQWVYKDADGAIKGAEEMPKDDGTIYLGWCTDKKVKKKLIPGLDNWNDVEEVATNLDPADWHTMKQVAGATKIANMDKLAMVGYDGSFTNEALDLIPGNIAKTLLDRDGRVIIGTGKKGHLTKGINAAIDAEVPLAQVGNDGKIYFVDMVNSMSSIKFPGGGQVNPGGVTSEVEDINIFDWEETALSWIDKQKIGGMALFAVYGADTGKGGIYSYGRRTKNHPFVLNLEYQIDADELGAIVQVDGVILVSYKDGTDYGVKAVDSTAKAIGIYEGLDFKAPVKKPVNITTWKQAEVFMTPLPVDAYIEFYYKINKTGSFVKAKTADGSTSFTTEGADEAVFNIAAKGKIFEHKIILYPSGNNSPEIFRINTLFL